MDNLKTIREVAQEGIAKERMLRRWLREGKLPGIWSGNRFYINVPMLEAWIDAESTSNASSREDHST